MFAKQSGYRLERVDRKVERFCSQCISSGLKPLKSWLSCPTVFPSDPNHSLEQLLGICSRLQFQPHQIRHLLDARGRYHLDLPGDFPFCVTLFHFRAGQITREPTWHHRLELMIPLDGDMQFQMGDLCVDLSPGDVLVVDHLKPHVVMDGPGLDTRALVVTFLAECVFSPGSPPADHAFLLPFHRHSEQCPHVLRSGNPLAPEAHSALARLLAAWVSSSATHPQAACKAWLLVLLEVLVRAFEDSALAHAQLLRRQTDAARLKPVFEYVRETDGVRLTLDRAAELCSMSRSVFSRMFRAVSGMSLAGYLNHVRMAQAVLLLEDTTDSIASIAARLGYSDQSHFDRRFRRTFGRTPSAHRARLKTRLNGDQRSRGDHVD